jgi:formamidopyrimidine-DNA glycosylase
MPELPEVETIKLQLKKYLVGHKIVDIKVNWKKTFPKGEKRLKGGEIINVRRFGKALSIDLDNDQSVIIHVKLTGQLIYRGPNLKNPPDLSKKVLGGVPGKHTHVIFFLDNQGVLYFNDIRKFGWIKVMKTKDVEKVGFIGNLGPEPFRDLTYSKFKQILEKSSRPIKILLMDQKKISGIGNIYANDALYLAKIRPPKKADILSSKEQNMLFNAILKVLKDGIKRGGASELAYVAADGKEGKYQEFTLVYGKEGKLCKRCKKTKIKKTKMGGRGTYYCDYCQR